MVQTRRQAKGGTDLEEGTRPKEEKVDPMGRETRKANRTHETTSIKGKEVEPRKVGGNTEAKHETNEQKDVLENSGMDADVKDVFARAASHAVRRFLQKQAQTTTNTTNHNGPIERERIRRHGSSNGQTKERTDAPVWKPNIQMPEPLTENDAFHAEWETKERLAEQRNIRPGASKGQPRKWYSIPTKEITPEVKMDLKILKLRNALDPKRFYKSNDDSKLPERFEFGTVVEPAAEFYSSRLTKAKRKRSITEELLSDRDATSYTRKKFLKMQEERMQWGGRTKGKGAYKKKNVKHKKHGKY